MNAIYILQRLTDLGLMISVCDGDIKLEGHAVVPDDLLAAMKEHKAEILAYIQRPLGHKIPKRTLFEIAIWAAALSPEDRAALLRLLQSEPSVA